MQPSAAFPPGFFDRADSAPDGSFYGPPRLVTHIDDAAVAAVGSLYTELGLAGDVLDLMSSWISHFARPPANLTILGMNAVELSANTAAAAAVVHDLNMVPALPFADESFDAATCCVSVDYLTSPVEVFSEVARTLRPRSPFVCTFSNRCFPTKAIRGWLVADDATRCHIVAEYFRQSAAFCEPVVRRCVPPGGPTDPLFAVWAHRTGD